MSHVNRPGSSLLKTHPNGFHGLFRPTLKEVIEQRQKIRKDETVTINMLHCAVLIKQISEGLGALSGSSPIRPERVEEYNEGKFDETLGDVRNAWESFHTVGPLRYSSLHSSSRSLVDQFIPVYVSLSSLGSQNLIHYPKDGF